LEIFILVITYQRINSIERTTISRLYYTSYIFKIKILVIPKFYKNGIVTMPKYYNRLLKKIENRKFLFI